jgi:hypothetical protein
MLVIIYKPKFEPPNVSRRLRFSALFITTLLAILLGLVCYTVG